MDRGRDLGQILDSADLRTIMSLLHWLPTMPGVIDSQDREAIIADVQTLALRRLAEIGHEPAVTRLQAEQESALPASVARVFTEAIAGAGLHERLAGSLPR